MTIQQMLFGISGLTNYLLQRSVRFRASASAYFNRTPASATNRKTWTYSGWIKRGTLGANLSIMGAQANAIAGTQRFNMYFAASSDVLVLSDDSINISTSLQLITTQVFRDPSAWYHIVLAMDTTQATAANRVKLYVNGVQVTAFSTATYPSQNFDTAINNNVAQYLGYYNNLGTTIFYYDGYETEINFVDGQALTPTSFGSFNTITGVWQPKAYSGTYGTNGYYLNFQDNSAATAAAIGKDSSGNGNNWTPNGISVTAGVTYDSMTDVTTLTSATQSNYCTFNPLIIRYAAGAGTFSEANLKATGSSAYAWGTISSGLTGKYYWEMTVTAGTSVSAVGVDDGIGQTSTPNANFVVYLSNGQKTINATSSSYGATYTTGDVIGVALNMDTGAITFYKNNTSQGVISNAFTAGVLPHVECGGSWAFQANFGQRPFAYTPPSGFVALNTYNLVDSTITNGATQFAATTYTGTGAATSITNTVNGISMQPDFVWIKDRSVASAHALTNSVTGITKYLESNTTAAETTDTTSVTALNSNGFNLGVGTATYYTNRNGESFVAWQWKASNAAAVSNTSGTITSQISANTTAGFSIVTYTGNGTAGATVGHGLGVIPALVIYKARSATSPLGNWITWHKSISQAIQTSSTIQLNTFTGATYLNATNGSSTYGFDAQINGNGSNFVAYCFSEIAGYSKFGSYTGNGSADGPFIYLGFRPRMIMTKRTDTASQWYILDTARDLYNCTANLLFPNTNLAESSNTANYDELSNGFKLRSTNGDNNAAGGTFIYIAFAENPFKNALAR